MPGLSFTFFSQIVQKNWPIDAKSDPQKKVTAFLHAAVLCDYEPFLISNFFIHVNMFVNQDS